MAFIKEIKSDAPASRSADVSRSHTGKTGARLRKAEFFRDGLIVACALTGVVLAAVTLVRGLDAGLEALRTSNARERFGIYSITEARWPQRSAWPR